MKDEITGRELRYWVKASHHLIRIFWRGEQYFLSWKWVDEWFNFGEFLVRQEDEEEILDLVKQPDYEALGDLVQNHLRRGKQSNVGFAIAPYLFTWNIKRFKEYFRRDRNFSLTVYFKNLGEFVLLNQDKLRYFRNKNLVTDEVDESAIEIFEETNQKLKEIGIGDNEPIGAAKVLHILAPYYFPLIDNDIAEWFGLKLPNETLKPQRYKEWMIRLKKWLSKYPEDVNELQERFNRPILKLVDEGLWLMCSQYKKFPHIVNELGI